MNAEHNGLVEITVKGKKHLLRFSYPACMDFEIRVFKNPSSNNGKMFIDLIYSGMLGDALRNEKPEPAYPEVYDLADKLTEEDNFQEQQAKVWEAYNQSKWGKEWMAKIEAFNKKKVEEENQQIQEKDI